MAKKTAPIITHVEILHLAIRQLESEIKFQTECMEGIPQCQDYLKKYISERTPKIEALKAMYQIETGTKYD